MTRKGTKQKQLSKARQTPDLEERRGIVRNWFDEFMESTEGRHLPERQRRLVPLVAYLTRENLACHLGINPASATPEQISRFVLECVPARVPCDEPGTLAETLFAWLSWLADNCFDLGSNIRKVLSPRDQKIAVEKIENELSYSGKALLLEALKGGVDPEDIEGLVAYHADRTPTMKDYYEEFLNPPVAFAWKGECYGLYGWENNEDERTNY